jgi:eukaryotic-like serine/threonine-protein kinase
MALQRLGPFELLRVLGRGGMGTVYEAREPGSDLHVAVKALAPQFSFDERFRNRFEAEIDALLKLEHENIVRLLSYGQDEGNLYFAMELVDGCSLYQEQKKGQVFHWREIIDIGKQVCAGLRHAHERGIIHRDLKPGNLMIDRSRHVKITDFGIAKSFGSSSLTREGNVLGTMDFMSPEQARGEAVTARSDLFSLGAVLYALLSGRPPFLQETAELTFEMLLSNRPPIQLNRIATDTPVPLAMLIHRLLEKDPAKRIATAMATGRQFAHVEDAIESASDDTQIVEAAKPANPDSGSTFETRQAHVPLPGADVPRPGNAEETRVSTETGGDSEPAIKSPDYFNQVTPQQRKKSVATESATKAGEEPARLWPLLLALVVVLGVTAYGIWHSLLRPPDAGQLLSIIRAADKNPQRVRDELESFIERFPEHEEIPFVRSQLEFADAMRFRNTLQLRSRSVKSNLSVIESQFLEITEMNNEEAPEAADRMRKFLTVYAKEEESEENRKLVESARIWLTRLEREAENRIAKHLENLDDMLMRTGSGNDEETMQTYRFIIEEYEKDPWARDYVDKAKKRLLELEEKPGQQQEQKPPEGAKQ